MRRLFRVARRLGWPQEPAAPAYRDLALLFVAAEVEGQSGLNFEQEEAAILEATKSHALNLSVEESGAVEFLGQRGVSRALSTSQRIHRLSQ